MMKLTRNLFILSTLLISTLLFAGRLWAEEASEPYKRTVSFEFEAIVNAKKYDIEIKNRKTDEAKLYTTESAEWEGSLVPGTYLMRIRSKDKRGVAGNWSTPEEFTVQLESTKLVAPKPQEKIETKENEEYKVVFKWKPVPGAKQYHFELIGENGEALKKENLDSNSYEINLKVAKSYSWKVSAVNELGVESDAIAVDQFTLLGKQLDKVIITKPETKFVRELAWKGPEFAEGFDYYLSRYSTKTKTWAKVKTEKDFKNQKIPFSDKFPGGKYKLQVRSSAKDRVVSKTEEVVFQVVEGNRSPAAEEVATIRESIDRTNGWFAVASYLVTNINYSGSFFDANGVQSNAVFDAVGGTGRLGIGYLDSLYPWGFLTIIDDGGFVIDNANYTFASLEMSADYRRQSGSRGESRHQFGIFTKELPEVQGDANTQSVTTTKMAVGGFHYGYEYWYGLTNKLGLQVNMHSYFNLAKIKTPNNQGIAPDVSFQLGLLGSYRISQKATGLMGYAYRRDAMSYYMDTTSGDRLKQSVEIFGHYLNFFLEWTL